MAELTLKDDNGETYTQSFSSDLLNDTVHAMLSILGEATYVNDVTVTIHNPMIGDQSYKLVVDRESDSSELPWSVVEFERNEIKLEK